MIDKETMKALSNGGAWTVIIYMLWEMNSTLSRMEAMLDWVFQLKMQGN